MSVVQIIGMPQSPLVWAVRMVAAEKGIEAELVPAPPHAPELAAIQPFGKMPALRHGDVALGESRAIALYLDQLSPRAPLTPRDPLAAARAEQWVMHFYTEYAPVLLGRYIAEYFFPRTGEVDRSAIEAALPAMQKCVDVLQERLGGRDYLADDFSLADVLYGPLLHYVNTLPEGAAMIAAAPRVRDYLARLSARPAFKATFPPPMPARAAA